MSKAILGLETAVESIKVLAEQAAKSTESKLDILLGRLMPQQPGGVPTQSAQSAMEPTDPPATPPVTRQPKQS